MLSNALMWLTSLALTYGITLVTIRAGIAIDARVVFRMQFQLAATAIRWSANGIQTIIRIGILTLDKCSALA
jgi:hypothetical protein